MKKFKELMAQCPKHDCAYVLYDKRWHRITEHELRYICILVARGDLPVGIKVKMSDGKVFQISKNGRFEYNPFITESNIFRLNSILNRELNIIELKPNYKSELYGKK